MRLLQKRLALIAIVGVREVDGAGTEIPDRRPQARVVGQVHQPRILDLDAEIDVWKEHPQPGAKLVGVECIAVRVAGRRAGRRTEVVDELGARAVLGAQRDVVPPVGGRRHDVGDDDGPDDRDEQSLTRRPQETVAAAKLFPGALLRSERE